MSKTRVDRGRINVTFEKEDYEDFKRMAAVENKSMADIVRNYALQGKNGSLTQKNMDVIVPIMREQLSSLLSPQVERLATLSAKACVQAGTAAYLCAETINKFVEPSKREELQDTYIKARKKAVQYIKSRDSISNEDLD